MKFSKPTCDACVVAVIAKQKAMLSDSQAMILRDNFPIRSCEIDKYCRVRNVIWRGIDARTAARGKIGYLDNSF